METTILSAIYLLGLFYFAANEQKLRNPAKFRLAWIWFALAPLSQLLFALFRADADSSSELAAVEIWADGFAWACLGVSSLFFISALQGSKSTEAEQDA